MAVLRNGTVGEDILVAVGLGYGEEVRTAAVENELEGMDYVKEPRMAAVAVVGSPDCTDDLLARILERVERTHDSPARADSIPEEGID